MQKISICLFGAASSNIDDVYLHEAEQLGIEIGSRGHRLIFGGGATGMMGACARGVHSKGGELVSVFPEFMSKYELLCDYCSEVIRTETMNERKQIMEDLSDAFIIVPGGIGTMDEFFQILTLVALDRKTAPIIIYNIEGYFDDLIHFMDKGIHQGFIRPRVRDLVRICSSPEQALDMIEYFS